MPLHAVSAAVKADTTFLRHIANRRGGQFIDLTSTAPADAARSLLTRATHVARLSSDGASQLVMANARPQGGRVLIGGVLNDASARVILTIAEPTGRMRAIDVVIKPQGNSGTSAATQWAQLRVAELEGEFELNRAEIRRLGNRFKLVTRETSLIVLDRIEDYARFEIAPPAELRADYERVMATMVWQRVSASIAGWRSCLLRG